MPLVSLRQLLGDAAGRGYGLPVSNINNMEQVQAVLAAREVDSPAIVAASAGARHNRRHPSSAVA